MKLTEVSAVLGTWVGICGAILGGYLALQNYQADIATRAALERKQVDQRVEAAFEMVAEFHRQDFVAMRSRLLESVETQSAHCRAFQPPSVISTQEVFTLVEYFDRARLCVNAGLCDKATTEALLGPYANAWSPFLARQIKETRISEKTPDGVGYGAGFYEFAANPAKPAQCRQNVVTALEAPRTAALVVSAH